MAVSTIQRSIQLSNEGRLYLMFSLHPQLHSDTFSIGDLSLSRILLMNCEEIPWLILVPRRTNISEWHSLSPTDQSRLHEECIQVGSIVMDLFNGDKLNTAALGNLVPQLHVHQIVRFRPVSYTHLTLPTTPYV